MKIYGENKKTILKGSIQMKNESAIKDLVVIGENNPIVIDSDAKVSIEKCELKDFIHIGI